MGTSRQSGPETTSAGGRACLAPRWSAWGVATFVLLTLVIHDAHELAHTVTGRILCGEWAERDFNAWTLRPSCTTVLPTLMGPVLSYVVMWVGMVALRRASVRARWAGLALVFAANPLARLVTAIAGGGDEGVVMRWLLGWERGVPARIVTTIVVALIVLPPLVVAWRALARPKRVAWYAPLLVAPVVITGVLYIVALNRVLAAGVLATPRVAGMPPLIALTTLVTTSLFVLCVRARVEPG